MTTAATVPSAPIAVKVCWYAVKNSSITFPRRARLRRAGPRRTHARSFATGQLAALGEPRWLDGLEREATLLKLNSYLLGNRSSRPGQVLNDNLSLIVGRADVPCADVSVVGADHREHLALMHIKQKALGSALIA
jgi:hypothetical protein